MSTDVTDSAAVIDRMVRKRILRDTSWADLFIFARAGRVPDLSSLEAEWQRQRARGAPRCFASDAVSTGVRVEGWDQLGRAPLWRFTFPDGFLMVVVPPSPAASGVDAYFHPIARALRMTAHRDPVERLQRGVSSGAECLRRAALDPHEWLRGYTFGSSRCRYSSYPVTLLTEHALYGIESYAVADFFALENYRTDVIQFADAGFDVNTPCDQEWFTNGHLWGWHLSFTMTQSPLSKWEHLGNLKAAGWSIPAVDHLYYEVVERTPGFQYTTPEAWAAVPSGADEWIHAAGSAQLASVCITAGITLAEVRALRADNDVDVAAIETLAALASRT